jgi:hypothetical protein
MNDIIARLAQNEPPKLEIPIPGVTLTSITDTEAYSIPWIAQYISGVYAFLISIIGVIAAIMMIIGGFQYLTSAGDGGKIGAAKKRIVNALTGVILALSSYVILYTINPNLVQFEGLSLVSIDTELINQADDSLSNEHLDAIPSDNEPASPAVSTGDYAKICKTAADCLPYCKNAGCTKVFCTKEEMRNGYSPNCINVTRSNDCDWSRFPSLNSSSVLESTSPDLIPSSRWPSMNNIKPRGGAKASKLVVEGLQRADAYITKNYPGQGLSIQINNCWRDWHDDFNGQCSIIARPTKNDPSAWYSGWPGAGPHSSGYACDVVLMKNGQAISGVKSNQTCSSKGPGSKLLVEILTNPTVGARRLNYESWHFNWAGWNSCYCAMEECDKHIFPVGSGSRKCYDQITPKSC